MVPDSEVEYTTGKEPNEGEGVGKDVVGEG